MIFKNKTRGGSSSSIQLLVKVDRISTEMDLGSLNYPYF